MRLQHRVLRQSIKAALRLIYPSQCPGCGIPVASDGEDDSPLCPDCWRETRFITGTCCNRCGAPLADAGDSLAIEADLHCDDCLGIARPWTEGRAAMVYSGAGRRMVMALKHGDRPDLAPVMARWLARAAAPLIRPDMVVAPIPLHLIRLVKRRYNQAALVSDRLARLAQLKHLPDLLLRLRNTKAQDHRGLSDRFANVQGSVIVNPRHASWIAGRPILLVDDVMTAGATLSVAAQALVAAGSGPVSVAVLARAVKDD
ncbi:ComF family protein [Paracoccus caeni]|uniref:ComF family protein n=1 Tax=Paracoccus caeni TaxID=657651 RepID=A0A934VYH8_9RHOB|nr:ComF family protein [Paracoccus caeni]MBK4214770.1 ComF family protein [Paracoccus caeni]